MGKGVKLVAYQPMSRTYVVELGTQYNDLGAAKVLKLSAKIMLLDQRFENSDTGGVFTIQFKAKGKQIKYEKIGGEKVPVSGEITGLTVSVDGEKAYKFSGLDVPVIQAADWWFTGQTDPFGVFPKFMNGNDFIKGSNGDDPDIFGFKGNDVLWGRLGNDNLDGGKGNDVNDGGEGNDNLNDTKGDNTFQFSTPFLLGDANLGYNFDTIKKLRPGDEIYLKYAIFPAAGMSVSKGELAFSEEAQDANDFFLFFANVFSYDADGDGPGAATPIFQTQDGATLNHKMLEVGLSGDFY